MSILKGLLKVGLSPLYGAREVIKDLSGNSSDEETGLSILTCGVSSVVKGTAKGIKKGVDDIFN